MMKIEELKKDEKEIMVVVATRVPKKYKDLIESKNLDLRKLICKTLDEVCS